MHYRFTSKVDFADVVKDTMNQHKMISQSAGKKVQHQDFEYGFFH